MLWESSCSQLIETIAKQLGPRSCGGTAVLVRYPLRMGEPALVYKGTGPPYSLEPIVAGIMLLADGLWNLERRRLMNHGLGPTEHGHARVVIEDALLAPNHNRTVPSAELICGQDP